VVSFVKVMYVILMTVIPFSYYCLSVQSKTFVNKTIINIRLLSSHMFRPYTWINIRRRIKTVSRR